MLKILVKVLMELLADQGAKADKKSFLKNLAVVIIIVVAITLLQYSEALLNVRKLKTQHSIERPVEILNYKLESCNALLENTKNDLKFCRANTVNRIPIPSITTTP